MQIGNVNSSLLTGNETIQKAQMANENAKFADLLNSMKGQTAKNGESTISSSQVLKDTRLNGDFASDFSRTYTEKDKNALPQGAAANQAGVTSQTKTIDKTSKLYEKALELESYFVKIMMSSMRNTITKSSLLGGDSFASKMYEDMMYDEYNTQLTKHAGFGLADQIYLQLNTQA